MDSARADMLSARHRLQTGGWIARHAEHFRHPAAGGRLWLGGTDDEACEAIRSPVPAGRCIRWATAHRGRVEARWLDGADARQRAELLAGLPVPEDGDDAAPFAWAHRALCRHGLRLRIGGDERSAGSRAGIVWLRLRHQPRAAVEAPLLVLDLQPGAQVVLVERHERDATACSHAVVQNLQVHVAAGRGRRAAPSAHRRAGAGRQPRPPPALKLERGARHALATLAAGNRYLQRQVIELGAERSAARSAGVLFAGSTSTLEQRVRVFYMPPHGPNEWRCWPLARDKAHGGNAHAHRPGAAETEVRQRLTGIPPVASRAWCCAAPGILRPVQAPRRHLGRCPRRTLLRAPARPGRTQRSCADRRGPGRRCCSRVSPTTPIWHRSAWSICCTRWWRGTWRSPPPLGPTMGEPLHHDAGRPPCARSFRNLRRT